jgi:ferredoxin-NADP reductase
MCAFYEAVIFRIGGIDVKLSSLGISLLVLVLSLVLRGRLAKRNLGEGDGSDISQGMRREQAGTPEFKVQAEDDDRVLNPITFKPFTVTATTRVSHNTVLVRFAIPENRDLGLPIGRHVSARTEFNGTRLLRPYTPTTRPGTKGYFELLVKHYEDGKMSSHIWDLKVGDTLDFRGPIGRFKYEKNLFKQIGLIAGGTGLTPCLQVIRCILEGPDSEGDHTNIVLFFQNRTEEDILLKDDLLELASKYASRLKIAFFLSNPTGESWGAQFATPKAVKSLISSGTKYGKVPEVRGYISAAAIQVGMTPAECELVGLCGPSGFNNTMKELLIREGHVPEKSLYIW